MFKCNSGGDGKTTSGSITISVEKSFCWNHVPLEGLPCRFLLAALVAEKYPELSDSLVRRPSSLGVFLPIVPSLRSFKPTAYATLHWMISSKGKINTLALNCHHSLPPSLPPKNSLPPSLHLCVRPTVVHCGVSLAKAGLPIAQWLALWEMSITMWSHPLGLGNWPE